MVFPKSLSVLAAIGLVVSPISVQAASADKAERTSAKTALDRSERLTGNGLWLIIAAVVAIGVGIIIITGDDDEPDSP